MEEAVGRNPEKIDLSEMLNKPKFQQFLEDQGAEEGSLKEFLELLIKGDTMQEKRSTKADPSHMPLEHLLVRTRVTRKFKNDEEKNTFLTKLYRLYTAYNIEHLQQIIQEEHLSELLSTLQNLDTRFPQLGMFEIQHFLEINGEKLQKTIDQLKKMTKAIQTNHEKLPFDKTGEYDEWQELLECSADLTNISNIIKTYPYLKKIQSLDLENEDLSPQGQLSNYLVYLQSQAKALQGCLRLLDNSKRELLSAQKTETISDWSFLDDIEHLLSAQQFQREYVVTPVPMEIKIILGEDGVSPLLQNVDQNQLFQALLYMVEEAFKEEKTTAETLNKHLESKDPYLYIEVRKAQDPQGNDIILIIVADMGESVDFKKLEADTGIKINNGSDLIDALSSKDRNKKLHAAREIVRDNHGDITCNTIRDGGIGLIIALPVNGKQNPHAIRFVEGNLESYPCGVMGVTNETSSKVKEYVSLEVSQDSNADALPTKPETSPQFPK